MPPFVLQIAAILLHTIATHALGHLIGVAARPPARVYISSSHTPGPFLLDGVAVKRVVVVLIDIDVLVLRVAIMVLLDVVVAVLSEKH